MTITAVGTGTITLSDANTYNYNESGNQTTTTSVGVAHPDYLCNIDGVGVKIGTTDVANLASYSAFSGATSQADGSAGLVPAPTTGDVDKYLKGDGTWAAVSGGGLQNTATGTDSLTILGTAATNDISVNIGVDSSVNSYGAVAIGYAAEADEWGVAIGGYNNDASRGTYAYPSCVAIGCNAKAGSQNGDAAVAIGIGSVADSASIAIGGGSLGSNSVAIGIGSEADTYGVAVGSASAGAYGVAVGSASAGAYGTAIGYAAMTDSNTTSSIALGTHAESYNSYEFVVGGYNPNTDTSEIFKLMDLQTGKIPNDRINGATGSFTSADGKTITVTNGVITSIV
jgi:hypothetical protein